MTYIEAADWIREQRGNFYQKHDGSYSAWIPDCSLHSFMWTRRPTLAEAVEALIAQIVVERITQ